MQSPIAAMNGIPFKLQDSATKGEGSIIAIPPNIKNHTVFLSVADGVNSGKILVETAYNHEESWASVKDGELELPLSPDKLRLDFSGLHRFIRVRIVDEIKGGNKPGITAEYVGSK